jgi:hypothetical protein
VKALAASVIVAAVVVFGVATPIGAGGAQGVARGFGWTAAAANVAAPKSDKSLSVTYRGGLLTVHCANTALDEVFQRVEATTGIPVLLERQSVRNCRLTTIERQPLERALDRFFTDHGLGYVLVLAPNHDILTVRVFDPGERVQRAPPSPVRRMPGQLRRSLRWR